MNRKKLLLLLGVGLFIYLTTSVGWRPIVDEIHKLKWNFIPLFLIYAFICTLDSLGWRFGFKAGACRVGLFQLFWIRVAGEAVNNTTPTGYVGGEPVKAMLLKRHGIPMTEGLASLVVAKTTLTLSQILFVFIGLGLAFARLEISATVRFVLLTAMIVLTLLVSLFLFFQGRGLFSWIAKTLIRFKIAHHFLIRIMEKILELESHIETFYKASKKRFLLSFFFHFLGWLAGILEIYFILRCLHLPLGVWDAFVIEALHQLIRGLAFMVPGNLGTQEGGNLFIFRLFNLGSVWGLTVSLIRRIREIFWSGLGWMLLAFWGRKEKFGVGKF
ncbi:MAG: flippase-like domain-containing protein [Chlamydiae bacterium]|nr:flippase-like domain-containing protein [Chlamydiota bacterium]MBI3265604.1 flippase-like domain-containing protein [Chlamydiota bacterium]